MIRAIVLTSVFLVAGCGVGVNGMDNGSNSDAPMLRKTSGSTTTTKKHGGTTTQSPTTTITAEVQTTSAAMSATTSDWASSFSIGSTDAVNIAVDVPSSLTGHHQATVEVQAPGAYTFENFQVYFATDVGAGTGEQQAEALSTGGYRIWVSLPVAGTAIDNYGLIGQWAAEAYIDGASSPNASASFTLQY